MGLVVIHSMRKNLHQLSFVKHSTALSLTAALLLGSTGIAHAQSMTAYDDIPPPPLGMTSPYGKTQPRGQYVLPGQRKTNSTSKLPSLPRAKAEQPVRAPLALSGSLPSTRLLKDAPVPQSLDPRNHRASTLSTLRYATPRSGAKPYYPKPNAAVAPAPVMAESQPQQMLTPQAPTSSLPAMPFGKPSKPLNQETQVVVTAPAQPAQPRILPMQQPEPLRPAPAAPMPATPAPAAPVAPAPVFITQPRPEPLLPDTSVPAPVVTAENQAEFDSIITPPAVVEDMPAQAPMPWEMPDEQNPVVVTLPREMAADTQEEFNSIVDPLNAPSTPQPEDAQILTDKPEMPAGDITSMPLEPSVALVETQPVEIAPVPSLSEASRSILQKTPSGIDSREVIARTPKPVIIKREDPTAGEIPKVDVRTHEEMGLRIEVRTADVNVHEYLEQGYENLLAGREAIAAGYYIEAMAAEPKNELAIFGLATTYQRMGRNEEARELYGKLLAINPTHREALNNFMALISDESPQEAVAELEKLESENPDFSPIPAQLGVVYNKIGNREMAAKKFASALQLDPDNISYKYNLAVTLDDMGYGKDAAELYMELIQDYNDGATLPGDIVTIRNRAIFLNKS